jgi:hypothetical protein
MTYFPDADDPLFTRTCKSLKNAPNLTKLEVGLADIEIADLEELHKNLPKLYSFTIFSSTLSDSRENKAEIVRPTDNLKIFKANRLQYTGSFRIDNIDYFAKKYDSLQHMPFFIQGRIGADSCQKKIEEAFINFISNNNQTLKNLELDLPFSTTRILENIDMTKLEHIQTDVILSRRILAKNLSLVNHDNLKTLKLKNVPPIALECFKELTALVFLELAFKEKRGKKAPFAISQVATALPKLKTLSLLFPEIKIESNKNLLPSSLKHLYLANSETPDNFSDYLTRQVKCLRTLVLDDCKLEANFELPEHRLSLVSLHVSSTWPYHSANHVSNHRDSLGGAINLKLTIGNTTKYYNHRHGLHYEYQPVFKSEYFSKHDSTLRKSAKPGPFDSSKAYFNFMCADIQVFYFKGHVVM